MRLSAKLLVIAFICVGSYYLMSSLDSNIKSDKARVHTPHSKSVLNVKPNINLDTKPITNDKIPEKPVTEKIPPKKVVKQEQPKPKPKPKPKQQRNTYDYEDLDAAYKTFLNNKDTIESHTIYDEQPDLTLIKPGNTYPALPRQNEVNADSSSLDTLNDFIPPELPPSSYSTEKPVFSGGRNRKHVIFCATSGSTGTEYLSSKKEGTTFIFHFSQQI